MLAMLASQALHVTSRRAPPPLSALLDEVRAIVPPVDADRVLGPELARLAEHFTQQVFSAEAQRT
jgi:histidine ammonia-lyase